jgi:hypothetical protein
VSAAVLERAGGDPVYKIAPDDYDRDAAEMAVELIVSYARRVAAGIVRYTAEVITEILNSSRHSCLASAIDILVAAFFSGGVWVQEAVNYQAYRVARWAVAWVSHMAAEFLFGVMADDDVEMDPGDEVVDRVRVVGAAVEGLLRYPPCPTTEVQTRFPLCCEYADRLGPDWPAAEVARVALQPLCLRRIGT